MSNGGTTRTERSRWGEDLAGTVARVLLFGAAAWWSAAAFATTTTSTTHHDTHTRVDIADAQAYQTRVLGFVFWTDSVFHSAFVFDQTVPNAPSSPEVDTLFNQAFAADTAALNAVTLPAGCTNVLVEAPRLVASSDDRAAAVPVGTQFNHSETSVTTTTAIGPATILIGEDQSQTFFVAAGTVNVNTNTHTENFIDDLFQATATHNRTYQVDGTFACASAAPAPALSPIALLATALLLGSLGAWHLARRRR